MTARDSFFTVILDLGEIEIFLILYMVRDRLGNAKDRKGWDFGNTGGLCPGSVEAGWGEESL